MRKNSLARDKFSYHSFVRRSDSISLSIDVFISAKLSRREYTWQRFEPNGIPDHQLFPHLIQLLFPSPLPALLALFISPHFPPPLPPPYPSSSLTNRRFNGPPRPKTPGKIIQISSLRFPSNLGERGSTRVDAQHGGASGARVPTDVSQSGPDYKPAITVRPQEQ